MDKCNLFTKYEGLTLSRPLYIWYLQLIPLEYTKKLNSMKKTKALIEQLKVLKHNLLSKTIKKIRS